MDLLSLSFFNYAKTTGLIWTLNLSCQVVKNGIMALK